MRDVDEWQRIIADEIIRLSSDHTERAASHNDSSSWCARVCDLQREQPKGQSSERDVSSSSEKRFRKGDVAERN